MTWVDVTHDYQKQSVQQLERYVKLRHEMQMRGTSEKELLALDRLIASTEALVDLNTHPGRKIEMRVG